MTHRCGCTFDSKPNRNMTLGKGRNINIPKRVRWPKHIRTQYGEDEHDGPPGSDTEGHEVGILVSSPKRVGMAVVFCRNQRRSRPSRPMRLLWRRGGRDCRLADGVAERMAA